jgi:hypothetical protein
MVRVHDRFGSPWFYERDGKSWDATMQRFHHDLKMRVYRAYSRELAEFVDRGFVATGMAGFPDGVLRYRINGTVKSGHNDTTLGNSLINAMIALEACCILGIEAEILVAGDDLLIATAVDPSQLSAIEATFGIVPDARVFRDYIDVSFISGCWLRADGGFKFCPKLGRLFAKLWWTVQPPSARHALSYRQGVVSGLGVSVGDVPLYRDFLRAETAKPMAPEQVSRDFARKLGFLGGNAANADTTIDLMRKYHLLPSEFEGLATFLRELPMYPCYFSTELVDRVLDVDLADLQVRPLAEAI